jgi:LuxR family maltose regulon positive regulatory protein
MMLPSLFAARTRIPPQRPHLVQRARLSEALERDLPSSRVALITAPAGYGKTTLLCQWAHSSRLRVAWFSLQDDDNDVERFLRGLVTAWDRTQPGIRDTPPGRLLGATEPSIAAVLSAIVDVGSEIREHTIFVLDDCHLVNSEETLQALAFLIDHLPPMLHVVIVSRGEPMLPLARYRAHGELLELGSEALRFRDEEARAFLRQSLPMHLSDSAIASLLAALEGWIAGLQLACHAIRQRPETAQSPTLSGKHRFIAQFLHEELLASLDAGTLQFLLQTCLLEQLHGDLCDAMTDRHDSQQMLETLERDALFLTALDDTREWFRYHPLFADVLREELRRRHAPDAASLHRRAARWYQDRGMPEQAFRHAVAGNDVDLVTQIGDDYAVIKMESGELNVVGTWLQLIPGTWFAVYPLISLLKVEFLIFAGAIDEGARLLDDVEQRIRRSDCRDRGAQLAKIATVRCAIACFLNDLSSAEAFAAEALGGLPAEDRVYRANIYHALGDTYSRNARWTQARESYLQALRVVHEPSHRIRSVHIFGALADLELRRGHLGVAADYWRRALAISMEREMWARLPIPVTGWVSIRMGELLYERNVLADASAHLERGLEIAQLGEDARSLIAGYLLSARLKLAEGDAEQAGVSLDRARPFLQQAQYPEWNSRFRRYQLEVWLALDGPGAMTGWIDMLSSESETAANTDPDIDRLALARGLLAHRGATHRERALRILRPLIDVAAANGRKGIQIEALALMALALWAEGDRAGGLTALECSLRIAEPEGYVRTIADLGPAMTPLLHEAASRNVLPAYARQLLAALTGGTPPCPGASPQIPEPLSAREVEVLRLMAAGLTNREIGESLFISPETVKKHGSSIFAKLAVGHRTQAVARARDLGIFDHDR